MKGEYRKLNMKELETQQVQVAITNVMNMLQRPGQLEKVESYKQQYIRKKASAEALLKSAMQSQLNGFRDGLQLLKSSSQDMKDVEKILKQMNQLFTAVPDLHNKLSDVREENMRHSQYVTARENLKNIFQIPESVEKTKQWINEGKLLHTHQCLRDLENSRDELLFELHKLPNQSPHDTVMLKAYFSEVETLSKLLEKQLRLNLSQTLNAVRKKPTVIVTAFRIIKREEKADEEALKYAKNTGFMAPGRPKKWKDMCFEVLEKAVATRIEGTQIEGREDNKLWLIRYLELIRLLILEDLRVVKTLCVPCVPKEYNIIDRYIEMYNNCLSNQLNIIIENGLEGNEYVSVLSWTMNTYKGPELMGHPDLIEHTQNLGPLLNMDTLNNLQKKYLFNMENNYIEWLQKTLETEKNEWRSSNPPRSEMVLRTAGPSIVFEMIGQNLDVTKTINLELTNEALFLSIKHVENYAKMYREAISDFKNKHFEDRSQVPYFTQYMIATVNNCIQLVELGLQFIDKYSTGHSMELEIKKSNYKKIYINLRNQSCFYLLEEAFLDLDKHYDELFTSRWVNESLPLETISATLEDYFQDYNRLVDENFEYIMNEARNLVTKRYIVSMLQKKIVFKTYQDCLAAANQITKEANKLKSLFFSIAPNMKPSDNPLDIIGMLAEVFKSEDDMLSLDLHRLVEKYPDISEDHLSRLLYLRGDIPKSELRDKVNYVIKQKSTSSHQSIFSKIVFPKSLMQDIKSNIP